MMADKLSVDFRVLDLSKPPRVQQEIGAAFLIQKRKCILGDSTGLGKTYTTLLAFALSDYYYKQAYGTGMMTVVIARKNAVFKWRDEVYKWFGNRFGVVVIDPNMSPNKRYPLYHYWGVENPILILTYNTMQRDFKTLLAAVNSWSKKVPMALVTDEAQFYKSHQSKNHEYVSQLSPMVPFTWALTATPYHNHPLEYHGIMSAVDEKYAGGFFWYIETFINYYRDHFSGEIKVRKRNPIKNPQYYDFVFGRMLARERVEGMPGVTVDDWYIPLHPEQEQAIHHINIQPKSPFENPHSRPAKKQKIVDSPESMGLGCLSPKLQLLDNVITMLDHRKVVIYTPNLKPLHQIVDYINSKGFPAPHIDGDITSQDRFNIMTRFNTDPSVRAIVIDDAGGDSIDLQAADMLVFYTLPFSNINYHQVVGRIKRLNSEYENVEVIHFLCGESDYHRLEVLGIKNQTVEKTKQYSQEMRSAK
jgi:SNF2 family DNA or RNA helicase